MRTQNVKQIGVCSWSLQSTGAEDLRDKVKMIGLSTVQLGLTAHRGDHGVWTGVKEILGEAGISIVSGMFSTIGEDYSTPETIKVTGGIVPDQYWEENWELARNAAATAQEMGLACVMTHAGFLPHEASDPNFEKLIGRIIEIARMFADHGLTLNLETGQESAETLLAFIGELRDRNVANVAVNFDPANMIMYDMDEPIEALRQLAPHVRGVHVKDAIRTSVKGEWGAEVVVGTGQVDWSAFVSVLADADFKGAYIFEREAGDDRIGDISKGVQALKAVM
jgi:L-ribulose-5-phosphate 3-epimerase